MALDIKQLTLASLAEAPVSTRRGVVLVLFIAVVVLGYWFFITPQSSKLTHAKTQEDMLKSQLISIYQSQQMIQQQAQILIKAESEINRQLGDIPNNVNISDLLEMINKFGALHNLQFQTIKPLPEVDSALLHQLPVQIIANGTYQQLAAFLSDLANSPYLLTFGDLTISNGTDDKTASDPSQLQLTFTLQSYYVDKASS